MKQLAQYQDGRLELQDVPDPVPPPGGILVRTTHSVISPGTEKMKAEQARMNLLQKARARPDQVRKVLDSARTLGWKVALEKVRNRLESPTPLGYSASGLVVAVDEANTRFRIGDRVACGGAECAHHAELIAIPDLLAARVPANVPMWAAAYTTLCAISMQAVRQANVQLGSQVMVVGQGLVGQLATAILTAAGVRVLGLDLLGNRLGVALQMGAERVANPREIKVEHMLREWTGGQGVDAVLLCVGGKSSEPAELAVASLRDRGTLVIVGIYDAQLDWHTSYMKEIQVRYSRSYGPGRYDGGYEWGGRDYPVGYVRWTENRNFESCLNLMDSGRLNLAPVTTRRVMFEDALSTYSQLMEPTNGAIGVVLEYASIGPEAVGTDADREVTSTVGDPRRYHHAGRILSPPCSALDVIGAGNFARTMLLPHLKGRIKLDTVVNNTGLSARHVKEKFGFIKAGTDAEQVLGATATNAVLIATRHHLHAPMVLRALQQHQHVFVEKPLCLTQSELSRIDAAMADGKGSVMVGFNRRFAPATKELLHLLTHCPGPKSIAYHVFAGALAPDHWYANLEESGGRVLGEACHFLDFFCHVLRSRPRAVFAQTTWLAGGAAAFPDGVTAQVEFDDGSSAQLIYSPEGDPSFPKESFRIFAAGLVAECENFQSLVIHRSRKTQTKRFTSKGHREELEAWLAFLRGEAEHPLPYQHARQSTLLAFAVLDSIRAHRTIALPRAP
jgi:predicted dehydrogenase/threonine dehydrogenase-like Zn-dependent dehydrogenase